MPNFLHKIANKIDPHHAMESKIAPSGGQPAPAFGDSLGQSTQGQSDQQYGSDETGVAGAANTNNKDDLSQTQNSAYTATDQQSGTGKGTDLGGYDARSGGTGVLESESAGASAKAGKGFPTATSARAPETDSTRGVAGSSAGIHDQPSAITPPSTSGALLESDSTASTATAPQDQDLTPAAGSGGVAETMEPATLKRFGDDQSSRDVDSSSSSSSGLTSGPPSATPALGTRGATGTAPINTQQQQQQSQQQQAGFSEASTRSAGATSSESQSSTSGKGLMFTEREHSTRIAAPIVAEHVHDEYMHVYKTRVDEIHERTEIVQIIQPIKDLQVHDIDRSIVNEGTEVHETHTTSESSRLTEKQLAEARDEYIRNAGFVPSADERHYQRVDPPSINRIDRVNRIEQVVPVYESELQAAQMNKGAQHGAATAQFVPTHSGNQSSALDQPTQESMSSQQQSQQSANI